MRTHRTAAAIAAAAVLGLVGACADPDAADPGQAPDPPASPVTPDPPMPTPDGDLATITGQLAEGVEAGCVLLRTETEEYLLIVDEEELPDTGTVTVSGYPDPDLPTICQQGVPFIVEEVSE